VLLTFNFMKFRVKSRDFSTISEWV